MRVRVGQVTRWTTHEAEQLLRRRFGDGWCNRIGIQTNPDVRIATRQGVPWKRLGAVLRSTLLLVVGRLRR